MQQGRAMNKTPTQYRDPYTTERAVFAVGFHQGSLVWSAVPVARFRETKTEMHNKEAWPFRKTHPYSEAQLGAGVIADENLVLALDLKTAVDIWSGVAKRRKERADRVWTLVGQMERAFYERRHSDLLQTIAEI